MNIAANDAATPRARIIADFLSQSQVRNFIFQPQPSPSALTTVSLVKYKPALPSKNVTRQRGPFYPEVFAT